MIAGAMNRSLVASVRKIHGARNLNVWNRLRRWSSTPNPPKPAEAAKETPVDPNAPIMVPIDTKTGSIFYDTPIVVVLMLGGFGLFIYHGHQENNSREEIIAEVEHDMVVAPSEWAELKTDNKFT